MKSDIVYIVTCFFANYDSYYTRIIGTFDDVKKANEVKEKWEKFYSEKKNKIFDKPKWWDDKQEWTDSNEYYRRQAEFEEIFDFKAIAVDDFPINQDLNIKNCTFKPEGLLVNYMTQWDRDYKLNKLDL